MERERVAVRVRATVATWRAGRTPDDGPPDAVQVAEQWQEPDGTPITDPARVAALEAAREAQQEQED